MIHCFSFRNPKVDSTTRGTASSTGCTAHRGYRMHVSKIANRRPDQSSIAWNSETVFMHISMRIYNLYHKRIITFVVEPSRSLVPSASMDPLVRQELDTTGKSWGRGRRERVGDEVHVKGRLESRVLSRSTALAGQQIGIAIDVKI